MPDNAPIDEYDIAPDGTVWVRPHARSGTRGVRRYLRIGDRIRYQGREGTVVMTREGFDEPTVDVMWNKPRSRSTLPVRRLERWG